MQVNNNLSYLPTFIYRTLFYLFSPKGHTICNIQEGISSLVTGQNPRHFRDWKSQSYQFNEILLLNSYRRHNSHFKLKCPENKRLILKSINSETTLQAILKFIEKNEGPQFSKTTNSSKALPTTMPHSNKNCENTEKLMNRKNGTIFTEIMQDFIGGICMHLVVVILVFGGYFLL